jgi:lysophospholipase L1-like esterase
LKGLNAVSLRDTLSSLSPCGKIHLAQSKIGAACASPTIRRAQQRFVEGKHRQSWELSIMVDPTTLFGANLVDFAGNQWYGNAALPADPLPTILAHLPQQCFDPGLATWGAVSGHGGNATSQSTSPAFLSASKGLIWTSVCGVTKSQLFLPSNVAGSLFSSVGMTIFAVCEFATQVSCPGSVNPVHQCAFSLNNSSGKSVFTVEIDAGGSGCLAVNLPHLGQYYVSKIAPGCERGVLTASQSGEHKTAYVDLWWNSQYERVHLADSTGAITCQTISGGQLGGYGGSTVNSNMRFAGRGAVNKSITSTEAAALLACYTNATNARYDPLIVDYNATPPAGAVLIVGDSLAAGFGTSAMVGWSQRLSQRLGESIRFTNCSIGGWTATNLAAYVPYWIAGWLNSLPPGIPKVIIYALGTNDLLLKANYLAKLKHVIATTLAGITVQVAGKNVKIIAPALTQRIGTASNPNCPTDTVAINDWLVANQATLGLAALMRFDQIPQMAVFNYSTFNPRGQVHYNDLGSEFIANEADGTVSPMFKPASP